MKLRSCAYGPAILTSVILLAVPATAHAADCQDLTWSHDRLAKFDAVIASLERDAVKREGPATQATKDQVAELDAAIASLEQDVATHEADFRTRGEAVLNEVRASRDAYRAKLRQPAPHLIATAQAAEAGQSPEEAANAFWAKVNAYFDAVNADIAARQAATQTKFRGN